jgi:hypothetical protein
MGEVVEGAGVGPTAATRYPTPWAMPDRAMASCWSEERSTMTMRARLIVAP